MENIKVKKINNRRILVIFYILSMTIAFTTRYGDFVPEFHLQIIIGLFWLALGICQLAINGFKFKGIFKDDFPKFLKFYIFPHIVIHGYTILLMIIGKVKWDYFTTNLTVYVPTLLAIVAIYMMGIKAYEYTCIALVLSWMLSVGTSLLLKGPAIFPHAIRQAYFDPYDKTGGLTVNYLELHDLVLAIGYVVIFYLFSNLKLTKKQFVTLIAVFVIMTLGMKRVSILGLVLVILFHVIIKRFSEKKQYKFCLWVGGFVFIFCYLFIYLLSDGNVFYDIISKFGINVMGRNYYYKAIMDYASFSPSFLGIGRNAVTQLLNTDLSYLRVGGVHSDIIKMFVENGFILFGLWLGYYLIYLLRFYKKNYGAKAAVLYFGMTMYMFVLYMTDNIEIYFICQIFVTMIPIVFALKEKKNYWDSNS